MRFLKISDRLAIDMATIEKIKVADRDEDDSAWLLLTTRDGTNHVVRRFGTGEAAEQALDDLVREIEAMT